MREIISSQLGCSARAEMRRGRRRFCTSERGLLRPRGDAPADGSRPSLSAMAAPPARRCAGHGAHRDPRPRGCSARAEMRRRRRPSRCLRHRLLRPRGDAPLEQELKGQAHGAAPPARRCAGVDPGRRRRVVGCSARAEMRPGRWCARASSSRLLRPRGDAPQLDVRAGRRRGAAPPARRCAHHHHPGRLTAHGCSARAEMRPTTRSASTAGSRLLRPRGDAPQSQATSRSRTAAAPPARRCALPTLRSRGPVVGCSARAEMRPRCARRSWWRRWLLRPRGDAPRLDVVALPRLPAAPPARRCAAAISRVLADEDGCSARAEMRP